jgi:hypothetical protein
MTMDVPSVGVRYDSVTSSELCKHYHLLVTHTTDLAYERVTCKNCGDEVPNWLSRKHIIGRYSYHYRVVSYEEFFKDVALVTEPQIVEANETKTM